MNAVEAFPISFHGIVRATAPVVSTPMQRGRLLIAGARAPPTALAENDIGLPF